MFNTDNLGRLRAWSRSYKICKCKKGPDGHVIKEIDCSSYNEPVICNEDEEFRKVHKKRCISPVRKKRSIPTIRYHPENHRRIKRDISWKNGWTNESAAKYCENIFKSSNLVNRCKEVPGVDVSSPMASCVTDIQLSGTTDFSLAAVNAIRSQCLREASMNVTLRQETSPDKPSVLKLVKAVACPAECSERGDCVNGTCDCNDGYSGPDCSVDLNQPPLADSLEANGYCNRTDSNCDEIAVFGGPFIESDKFKCRLLTLESNAEVDITNAPVVESIGEVTCPLPVNRQKRSTGVPVVDTTVPSYRVAVSNDGQLFSRQLTVVIMNSNCMDCTIGAETVTCRMFDDYCYTEERCYKTGERYIYNDDYQCTYGQWQIITTTSSDGSTSSSNGDPTSSYGGPTSSSGDPTSSSRGTTSSSGGTTSSDSGTTSFNGGTIMYNGGNSSSYGDLTSSYGDPTSSNGGTTIFNAGTTSSYGDPTSSSGDPTGSSGGNTAGSNGEKKSLDGSTNSSSTTQLYSMMILLCSVAFLF
ncbi:von Willebrand factor D and EGF domain-containing protein-like [Patella vulgata]|uniref:von Willebrand factor D and EGF domain-containing protein-like n=1 Tax=Patella vulgata TaxID=6465 RepID=UPI0024A875C1|nr:von Willebrand factor D and EGF domain-containing protein-like [Patella vulgata]